jgi:hypothetical protein
MYHFYCSSESNSEYKLDSACSKDHMSEVVREQDDEEEFLEELLDNDDDDNVLHRVIVNISNSTVNICNGDKLFSIKFTYKLNSVFIKKDKTL